MSKKDVGASRQVDAIIARFDDWRGELLSRLRQLTLQADTGVVEECKWVKPSNPLGVPVWSKDGMICTGETYKAKVKLTFANGASIPDPAGLFNASLDGKVRRAIDIHEGETLDEKAYQALVRAAIAFNQAKKTKTR